MTFGLLLRQEATGNAQPWIFAEPIEELAESAWGQPKVRIELRDDVPLVSDLFDSPLEGPQLACPCEAIARALLLWAPQRQCGGVARSELFRQGRGAITRTVIDEQQSVGQRSCLLIDLRSSRRQCSSLRKGTTTVSRTLG